LIETVRDFLQSYGCIVSLSYDHTGNKANLFATMPGLLSATEGGLLFSGHTDVVPVEGQEWNSDPFVPQWRDGRIYARGSCDMKGFLGAALDLLPFLCNVPLQHPVHLSLSFDEELGCAGAPYLIRDMEARKIRPAGCIVGEPTGMNVVVAHKGIHTYRCEVRGKAAHSSLQSQGVNAIEYAARIIDRLRLQAAGHAVDGPFDSLFDVPHLTAQTGRIHGGIAINTIPAECNFEFEFRDLPSDDSSKFIAELEAFIATELLPEMRRVSDEAGIDLKRTSYAPALETSEEEGIVRLVRGLLHNDNKQRVAYATEAGLFQRAGVPTVVCGPGNIAQAHKANEFVEESQLLACRDLLRQLILSCAAQDVPLR
jgi:acetylornithine deacetylase